MQNLKIFSIAICLLTATSLSAQVATPIRKLKFTDMSFSVGGSNFNERSPSFAEMQNLTIGSKILPSNLNEFFSNPYYGYSGNNTYSILLGMKFRDASGTLKPNYRFRIGASYTTGSGGSIYGSNTETTRIDTLVGSNSGTVMYLDSIKTESYSANYSYGQLRVDASFLFGTNIEKRWSFYSGIGLSAGASINAQTEVSHSSYATTNLEGNQNGSYSIYSFWQNYTGGQRETFRNKTNVGILAYVPIGVDFRIGKKNIFFNHIHLFAEARPGLNVTSIPEMGTFSGVGVQMMGGLRVELP